MDAVILDEIPFQPDVDALRGALRIRPGSANAAEFDHLLDEALALARPKALYRLAFIEEKRPGQVVIAGRVFTSRVLRVNLETAQRVFAYAATCGLELEAWSQRSSDMLAQFWADAIKEAALHAALAALYAHLDQRYAVPSSAVMHPGSLEDWPIQEQAVLFDLLGDTQAAIGLSLNPSYLMLPTKSVSGVRFPLEESFASCQLCPRPVCPNRRAPYDPQLWERKYSLSGG